MSPYFHSRFGHPWYVLYVSERSSSLHEDSTLGSYLRRHHASSSTTTLAEGCPCTRGSKAGGVWCVRSGMLPCGVYRKRNHSLSYREWPQVRST